MHHLTVLSCLMCVHGLIGAVHAADKYTDENRPYEFGFTIDGEQHRHEKKDKNGIIMGEFGFITADGVYHVTVYATDENGRFKILSMKNIRVKPYPTSGGGVKKGHSIPFPPSENASVSQGPTSQKTFSLQEESKPLQINKQISSPAKSCSHCSLPTTTTKAPPPQLSDIAIVTKDTRKPETSAFTPINNSQNAPISSSGGQGRFGQQEVNTPYSGLQSNPPSSGPALNNPNYTPMISQPDSFEGIQQNNQQQDLSQYPKTLSGTPTVDNAQQNNYYAQQNPRFPQNDVPDNQNYPPPENYSPQSSAPNRNSGDQYNTQKESNVGFNNPQMEIYTDQTYPQQQPYQAQPGVLLDQPNNGQESSDDSQTPKDSSRNPKQYNDIPNFETGLSQGFGPALASQGDQPVSNRPTLVAAQMQIVPKDTDIHHRNPGEEEGLPNGLSKDDMTHLLYTFNYTVGFHGHQEEGYTNGAKKGYYYVTGRNGIRTRVDYIADEKGFRPRISQEVLDLLSDDVPKPETEKDEKYGLKGYEFKWLYYPTNERK